MSKAIFTEEEDRKILLMRDKGNKWATIRAELGLKYTVKQIRDHYRILEERMVEEEGSRPKQRMAVPPPPPPVDERYIKSAWPDGWSIKPPTMARLMGSK